MPSLATQSVQEMGGPLSVLARQRRDHIVLDALLRQLEETDGAAHQAVMNEVCRLVFPHAFAEEAVLWPAIRRTLDDGESLTLRVEREHQQINELVAQLERTSLDDPQRPALVRRTVELLQEDVRDEEDILLPRLQEAVTPRELRRLGVLWEAVRRTAPTRPHPIVARRPPGNVLAALPLSVLDRTRDRLDAVSRVSPAPLSHTAATASRRLATMAGRLEQYPPLQRGRHPFHWRARRDSNPKPSDP